MIRSIAALAAVFVLAAGARGDVLTHKDGRRIEGTITSEADGKIKIKTEFGELEFARADITRVEKGKTRATEFSEREAACKTAEDYYQLGLWAQQKRMTRDTKRCMSKALELDPRHTLAHQFFGHVLYKGDWLTPEERDKRQRADEEADMKARGLVRYQDRWVTPDEQSHLEKNEVLVDGKWLAFDAAQRTKGLELFESAWLPRAEALARIDVAAAEKAANLTFQRFLGPDAIVCGPQSLDELKAIADGLAVGRAWFDTTFQSKPGLELFGGRLAEFYMFSVNEPYVGTVDHFASLTTTVPPGWADVVKKTHGYLWWDPYPLSSVRQWNRSADDVVGHDYHHWGHLLLNRLGYDGRLLPPWFDEGVAALLEFRSHQRNSVFCRGQKGDPPVGPSTGGMPPKKGGTKAGKAPVGTTAVTPFDPKAMREGNWRGALVAGLSDLPAFDKLASLQFNELESADIAASMGIVEWLEAQSPGALRRFLDVLRKTAPLAPTRVLPNSFERERVYQEAFQSAAGMGWKEADQAWRRWIASK